MTRFTAGGKEEYPVVLWVAPEHTGTTELAVSLTLKAAKAIRTQLNDVIEWAVNMEDLRRERKTPNANLERSGRSGDTLQAVVRPCGVRTGYYPEETHICGLPTGHKGLHLCGGKHMGHPCPYEWPNAPADLPAVAADLPAVAGMVRRDVGFGHEEECAHCMTVNDDMNTICLLRDRRRCQGTPCPDFESVYEEPNAGIEPQGKGN